MGIGLLGGPLFFNLSGNFAKPATDFFHASNSYGQSFAKI